MMDVNNLNWSLEYYEEHTEECNNILNSPENVEKIPEINSAPLQNFADGTLVRYQGMVQDMLNPEYYPRSYRIFNKEKNESYEKPGKFRDMTYCKANEELKLTENDFAPKERLIFFCIPIPGTNKWVHDCKKKEVVPNQCEKQTSGVKREANDADEEDMETDNPESTSQLHVKKNKTDQDKVKVEQQQEQHMYSNNKYFPFHYESGSPCIVKVYEDEEKSGIVLNERIEVIGFLSLSPALEANWEDSDVEDKARHPPPSLVPRIHAVMIKKLKHCNPLLKQIIPYDTITNLIESARSELRLVLTQLLFEDTIAADYLLCHLLSKIYVRTDSHTLGQFSLNLFNINLKNFGTCLNDIIKSVVTNSHYIPLSTQLLNEGSFIPRKDYESNRLWSGFLQLCDDTHLIIDETKMNEGQLNNEGCLNIAALQKLFRYQEVDYNFGYYPVKYKTNVPLLVVSEGKSLFEADVRLKVKSDLSSESNFNESFEAVRLYLNEEVSNKIRVYLTAVRLLDFELNKEMSDKILEDYASLRQQDRQVNALYLHTLIILSRLLAFSHGRAVLNPEDWNYALEMETERRLRLK